MKNPGFQLTLIGFFGAALLALAGTLLAQPPEPGGANKKPVMRPKPQVIYHLPRASNYAATLHSQAKAQNNDLPIDSSMPTSLQLSRANANAAAEQARQEAARQEAARQEATAPPAQQQQQQQIKRPKSTTHRSTRPQSIKTNGQLQARPSKSHKK